MAAQRPRPSVLSLFDPLSFSSSASLSCSSSDSDKENDSSETSFFRSQKQLCSPVHKLRRRLIDVGEITVDEPNIRDLLEEEEELAAEIKQSVAIDEDENATLTFRDMAKAATPKWSARRDPPRETYRSTSTPRTPLSEIVLKDDETPMIGRKKMLRRQVGPKITQIDPSFENNFTSPLRNLVNLSTNISMSSFPTNIDVSGNESQTMNTSTGHTTESSQGTSQKTLKLATPLGILIDDTSIPVSISLSSPRSLPTVDTSPRSNESRLRPPSHLNAANRLSVDLHASFQLQFQSPDTFDLLNDKISFFGSTSGLDASLDEKDPLIDHDEDFDTYMSESMEVICQRRETVDVRESNSVSEREGRAQGSSPDHADNEAPILNLQDQSTSLPDKTGVPEGKSTAETGHQVAEDVPSTPVVSTFESGMKILCTPSASHPTVFYPSRPVPALKIVKRSKATDQQKEGTTFIPNGSRRSSVVTGVSARLRTVGRRTVEDASPIMTSFEKGEQAKAIIAKTNGTKSGDGPRRVLVSDGPKSFAAAKAQSNSAQVKPVSVIGGPRRVPSSVDSSSRSDLGSFKQPAKNARSGTTTASSIPKPVNRNAGSRIPAPPSYKQRFGVQIETGGPSRGSVGRRVN